jgi:hypothetical protein
MPAANSLLGNESQLSKPLILEKQGLRSKRTYTNSNSSFTGTYAGERNMNSGKT